MKNRIKKLFLSISLLTLISCTTDFPKTEINTENLSGFIQGGNRLGLYDEAGLRIDQDSISMTDWPVSRLINNLNTVLDTNLVDQTSATDFYTIKIANTGELEQIVFCDSIASVLAQQKLIK
jgi:hypothetical protein